MKPARIALMLAAAGLLSACAYVPPKEGETSRVSPDYTATGTVDEARAYVYGDRTVLDFQTPPAFLWVRDQNGTIVSYEKAGRYYRLARRLDTLTAWVNGHSVTFTAPVITRVFSAPAPAPATVIAEVPQVVKVAAVVPAAPDPRDAEIMALLDLCHSQLEEVRHAIEAARNNPKWTGRDMYEVNHRLDEIQSRLLTASSAIVQIHFPNYSTTFKPSPDVAAVIVAAGKVADQVNISGHTDAKIAGKLDPKIAKGRAEAARDYLVNHGVQPGKITVSSEASGDFIAPNLTKTGKTINRRVEIEFVSTRIASLQSQSVKLAQAATK